MILPHQKPRGIRLLDMGPRAREMQHEIAFLPLPAALLDTADLVGKGVDAVLLDICPFLRPLGRDHSFDLRVVVDAQRVAYAVLL